MTDHFQNEKNNLGIAELDNNHNQVNSKSVIDLMATRDDEVSQSAVKSFSLLKHYESLIFQLAINPSRTTQLESNRR